MAFCHGFRCAQRRRHNNEKSKKRKCNQATDHRTMRKNDVYRKVHPKIMNEIEKDRYGWQMNGTEVHQVMHEQTTNQRAILNLTPEYRFLVRSNYSKLNRHYSSSFSLLVHICGWGVTELHHISINSIIRQINMFHSSMRMNRCRKRDIVNKHFFSASNYDITNRWTPRATTVQ